MKNNNKSECYQTLSYIVKKPSKANNITPRATKSTTNGDLRNGGKR